MQLTESRIFINLKTLRRRLYQAQFLMQKAERVIYGTPLMNAIGEAIGAFALAFTVKEEKDRYLDMCFAWFTRLRIDLEFCVESNIIKFKHRKPPKDKDGKVIPFANENDAVSAQKVELFRLIADIDDEICKWRAYLSKGKTLHAKKV